MNLPASQYVKACPDTGASTNILNKREAKRMGLTMKKTKVKLENASMRVIGESILYAQVEGGKAQRIRIIISPDLKDKNFWVCYTKTGQESFMKRHPQRKLTK